MKKRILSLLLIITVVMSSFTCAFSVSAGAAEITDEQSVGGGSPKGFVDSIQAGVNSITVRGWAFDESDKSKFSKVRVCIGGTYDSPDAEVHTIVADKSRPDVDAFNKCGKNHGFEETISTYKIGVQVVYFYAVSVDEQSQIYLSAKPVTISGEDKTKPEILSMSVPIAHTKQFTVGCTVKDDNLRFIEMHVWYTSDKENTEHTYEVYFSGESAYCTVYLDDVGGKSGNYTIQIYAYDASDNYDVDQFTYDFYNPVGSVQELVDNGNSIKISGWAFDENDLSKSLEVSVYVGGDMGEGELTTLIADKPNEFADEYYNCGPNHGFEAVIPVKELGNQVVYVYIENVGTLGKVQICEFWVRITQDNEKPVIESFNAATGGYSQEVVLTAEISDNVAVDRVVFEAWDTENLYSAPVWCYATVEDGIATGKLNLYSLKTGNGSFLIRARAYDYGDNLDSAEITYDLYCPKGRVEVIRGIDGGLVIEGWAFDGNNLDESIEIGVYVGGMMGKGEEHIIVADKVRADIDEEYGCGKNHGFSKAIKTDISGNKVVFVYAKNIVHGTDIIIYANNVNITESEYDLGDVNLDGSVDVNDVTHLQMHLAGYKDVDGTAMVDTEKEEVFIVVNANEDDEIDISDATHIQMMLVGL